MNSKLLQFAVNHLLLFLQLLDIIDNVLVDLVYLNLVRFIILKYLLHDLRIVLIFLKHDLLNLVQLDELVLDLSDFHQVFLLRASDLRLDIVHAVFDELEVRLPLQHVLLALKDIHDFRVQVFLLLQHSLNVQPVVLFQIFDGDLGF